MGAIAGTIQGIVLSGEPFAGTGRYSATVSVTYPAYVASTDTTTVAAVGAAIAARRRDGKTVLLKDVTQGQSGKQGAVEFYNGTLAVSTDAITGQLEDIDGSEIDAASGVTERPCSFIVSYKLT